MIQGTAKTEKNYRAIYLDSSSSLKDFSFDRKKYFRKYVMNEEVEEKDNQAIKMGRIVETLLLEPQLFDEKFHLSACATSPTGLMLAFVDALYEATIEAIDEEGVLTKTFEQLTREAYTKSGYKLSYEVVLNKFVDSDNQIYYDEMLKLKLSGKTLVTLDDVTLSEKIVEELKVNFVTKDIVTLIDSKQFTVLRQHQVENYSVRDHKFKSMIDLIIIDHNAKTIQVYDLKCVWAVEEFYREYYLFRRAYIQGGLYYKAALFMAGDESKEYYGYRVLPPKFIVCDSINYYNPLIYVMTANDLKNAFSGFTYRDRYYPGIDETIDNLKWALESNVWNMSKENYTNNGVVYLNE